MNQKYIFMDIDNTLLDHDLGVPLSAIEAINEARKNEHKVFICTGRASSDMDPNINSLTFDGHIYSCGANIIIDNERIFLNTLNKKDVQHIIETLSNVDVAFNLEGVNDSFLNEAGWIAFRSIVQKDFATRTEAEAFMQSIHMHPLHELEEQHLDNIAKICVFKHDDTFYDKVVKQLPKGYVYTEHDLGKEYLFGEISVEHVNKATGIQKVLQHFNADVNDSIAFGDSMNDYSMIKYCSIGVCVGNGDTHIKEIADYVCPDIKENGIQHAFKHLKLI